MARRTRSLQTGKIYHVFNRSIASEKVFKLAYQHKRLLQSAEYYAGYTVVPFSYFLKAPHSLRNQLLAARSIFDSKVDVLAYAIMPTHYHFLLLQKSESGIYSFIRNLEISYAKYYNKRRNRHGGVFCHGFGYVEVKTDMHLLYVSRYIHHNPLVDEIMNKDELQYSLITSFSAYCGNINNSFLDLRPLVSACKSRTAYCEYILNS